MQRQSGKLTSRAGRLTPPSASLAFAEPATAVAGSAAGAATAGMATAAGGLGFSKVLAVVLGYCVMAGSLFRSVPQIIKVVQHNSTEGLSLMSYVVELCCYSVVIAYNLCQVRPSTKSGAVLLLGCHGIPVPLYMCQVHINHNTPGHSYVIHSQLRLHGPGFGFWLRPGASEL